MLYGYYCTLAYFLLLVPRYRRYRNWPYAGLIAWGLLTSVYELGAGKLWLSKDAIRLDIFLIVLISAFAYTLVALSYFIAARKKTGELAQQARLHACYLLPQLLVILGLLLSLVHDTRQSGRRIEASQRHFLAACWRNPATQQRCFGELHSLTRDMPGYFRNPVQSSNYRELLINRNGGFSLISNTNYLIQGQLEAQADGSYRLINSNFSMGEARLKQLDPANWQLDLRYAQSSQHYLFHRTALPDSAQVAATSSDSVKFIGVFSALEKKQHDFFLTQVWIWQDHQHSWGYSLRQNLVYGARAEFFSPGFWQQDCKKHCDDKQIQFTIANSRYSLSALSAQHWQFRNHPDQPALTLHAGQYIPILMLDQAPLDQRAQNQQWLAELNSLYHGYWQVPAADQLTPF